MTSHLAVVASCAETNVRSIDDSNPLDTSILLFLHHSGILTLHPQAALPGGPTDFNGCVVEGTAALRQESSCGCARPIVGGP